MMHFIFLSGFCYLSNLLYIPTIFDGAISLHNLLPCKPLFFKGCLHAGNLNLATFMYVRVFF